MNGILNIDKPAKMSSAAVVGTVKRMLPRRTRIGHAGTLDPFATGVLLLLIGHATKRSESLMDAPKQYEATVRFGATTATDDLDSPEVPWPGAVVPIAEDQVRQRLPNYIGKILQLPPQYSALKIGGRPAYQLARKGHSVTLAPREVNVYGIELLSYAWPELRLRIDCGRGTYIRAIARDLGADLQVGGYLTQLRRTRVGEFSAQNAVPLENCTRAVIERFTSMEQNQ